MSWREFWRSLTDPPHQKPIFVCVYVITMITGLATILNPPMSIKAEVGPVIMDWIGITWLVAGAVAVPAMITGWWWVERIALGLASTGIAMYGAIVMMLHFQAEGSRLTQLGVMSIAICAYLLRWVSIRERSFEPRGQ